LDRKINQGKNPFSLWEKVVAEQPDEGLMAAIKNCNIELFIANTRTSSVMLRMTPSSCKEKEADLTPKETPHETIYK